MLLLKVKTYERKSKREHSVYNITKQKMIISFKNDKTVPDNTKKLLHVHFNQIIGIYKTEKSHAAS